MADDPFYENHRMTRPGMEQWLAENRGSIIYTAANGQKRLITSVDQLPSEAELAKGNQVQETRVRQDLQTQMRQLQQQMALLTPDTPAPPLDATAPATATAGSNAAPSPVVDASAGAPPPVAEAPATDPTEGVVTADSGKGSKK